MKIGERYIRDDGIWEAIIKDFSSTHVVADFIRKNADLEIYHKDYMMDLKDFLPIYFPYKKQVRTDFTAKKPRNKPKEY